MPRTSKKTKAVRPPSNVHLFPRTAGANVAVPNDPDWRIEHCYTMSGDHLEAEYGIKDGDLLLIRNDLPLIAIGREMLCILDDDGIVARKVVVHDTRYFTAVNLSNCEEVLTSLKDTPLLGVVVAFQRSLNYATYRRA